MAAVLMVVVVFVDLAVNKPISKAPLSLPSYKIISLTSVANRDS